MNFSRKTNAPNPTILDGPVKDYIWYNDDVVDITDPRDLEFARTHLYVEPTGTGGSFTGSFSNPNPVTKSDLSDALEPSRAQTTALRGEFSQSAGPVFKRLKSFRADAPTIPTDDPMIEFGTPGLSTSGTFPSVHNTIGKQGASAKINGTSPTGNYRMYIGTDHANADGHINLYTSPSPVGPWTNHGEIHRGTNTAGVGGQESETPAVMYCPDDPAGKPWYMWHQQQAVTGTGAGQATIMFRSANGVDNWEYMQWPISPPVLSEWGGGNLHTGYFRPFWLGQKSMAAYSLLTSGDLGQFCISYSTDQGLTWRIDPRLLVMSADQMPDVTSTTQQRIEWNTVSPFRWGGQLWIATKYGELSSGVDAGTAYFSVAPLAPNLRRLLAPPRVILSTSDSDSRSWESSRIIKSIHPFTDRDGTLYLYYQVDKYMGVAKATSQTL